MIRFVVLDLETAPDPQTLCLLRSEKGLARATWAIQRIEGIGILVAEIDGQDACISTFLTADGSAVAERNRSSEREMLETVAHHLEGTDGSTILVTYNGNQHDIPILRRRAFVNGLSHRPCFGWQPPHTHEDAMITLDPAPRGGGVPLVQAAAGLGIPAMHRFPTDKSKPSSTRMRKCQVDVLATFLVHAQSRALREGHPASYEAAWDAVDRMLGRSGTHEEHLLQFRRMQKSRLKAAVARRD